MYNLLVSSDFQAWEGDPCLMETLRCVREYTSSEIVQRFGTLDSVAITELKRLPCIFAYESYCQKPPKFGVISAISKRQDKVRIQYEVREIEPFLTSDDLATLASKLDIDNWELNRTHWAVKDVDLARELQDARGIPLPRWAHVSGIVDIETHIFDVALSFPGENRSFVEQIARELKRSIGSNSCFYDDDYVAQLARPSLDLLLQNIYRKAKLVVIFLSSDYQRKEWCGIEWHAIREIIKKRNHNKSMYIKMDDGEVDGVLEVDGYIDGRKYSPEEIAWFIQERLEVLKNRCA